MEPIIEIKDINLSYTLVNPKIQSVKDFITSMSFKKLFTKKDVIKNLSLNIYKSEVLGIVGKNGTGKSTLLKAIAGILEPMSGKIIVRGKIAPLLSLGSGIELELTGYENIKLLGSLMGYSRKQMMSMNEKVIAFSELSDEQLQAPVKTYSSGMMARLSFSIAITETPEILIIDEVLAVGDQGFQRKCMNRINEIHKKGGTILFVSHSLADVQRICTRGICINNNVIEKEGNLHEVGKYYNSLFEN